jgi:hypothetical protein
MNPVHGIYGLPYHHEGGDEHRHDGVTDIHEGGAEWHVHETMKSCLDCGQPLEPGPYCPTCP